MCACVCVCEHVCACACACVCVPHCVRKELLQTHLNVADLVAKEAGKLPALVLLLLSLLHKAKGVQQGMAGF